MSKDIKNKIKSDIQAYERDIKRLEIIKKLYDDSEMLCGGFANHMYSEINEQINFCKECINNLKKYLHN